MEDMDAFAVWKEMPQFVRKSRRSRKRLTNAEARVAGPTLGVRGGGGKGKRGSFRAYRVDDKAPVRSKAPADQATRVDDSAKPLTGHAP